MTSLLKKFKVRFLRRQMLWGRYLSAQGASDYTILIILSVILGTVAGFAAVGFHHAVDFIAHLCTANPIAANSRLAWLIILFPMLGMFIQWLMVRAAPQEAERKGVIEIIKAVSLHNGDISFKTTLFHFFAPAISIGTGNTVGPETPVAQAGAGFVSAGARLLGLTKDRMRIFTAAGAGAAIAGVFNTPLAGVFFCIEVILLNEIRASALSVFLLTSVSASAVSRIFLGNTPAFYIASLHAVPMKNLGFYLLLGLGAGLLSLLFIRAGEFAGNRFEKWYSRFPQLGGMLLVGGMMGLAGHFFPDLLGVGYTTINKILTGQAEPLTASIFFGLKFTLVTLILACGGFGGIFAPSLFLGACWGSLLSAAINNLTLAHVDPTTFVLVGMGAMLAGINSVPITAIIMLFEMTNDYHFILPLMVGVVGSHAITHLFLNGSIYQRKLEHAGYQKAADVESSILRATSVRQVARPDILLLPQNTPLSELVRRFLDDQHDTVYLHNAAGKICSVISARGLQQLILDYSSLQDVLIAQDIADPFTAYVPANSTLEEAMRLFARHRIDELPVIDAESNNIVIGALHYYDIINIIDKKMVQQSIKSGLAMDFKNLEKEQLREVIPGFSLGEISVPDKFIGRKLAQLRLRNIYDIDVLMIERSAVFGEQAAEQIFAHKDFIFNRGDKLIVYGRTLDVVNFQKAFEI